MSGFMGARPMAVIAAILLAVFSVPLSPPAPAQAAPGDLTCTVLGGSATFHPALTPGGSAIVAAHNLNLSDCFSLTGQTMTSGVVHTNGPTATANSIGLLNCPLLLTITGDLTINWQPGTNSPSHVEATLNTDPLNGTTLLSLVVISGSLAGDSIYPALLVTINSDCATAGLTTLTVVAAVPTFL